MLWRPKPLSIDPEDPLAGDRLGRAVHVGNLATLLANSPEGLVLSVDGPWGAGKSTFLGMLAATLRKRGHQTLSFNAWEQDYVPDPLVALLGQLSSHLKQLKPKTGSAAARAKKLGLSALRRGGPVAIRALTAGFVDASEASALIKALATGSADELADLTEEYLEAVGGAQVALEGFKAELTEMAEHFAPEGGKGSSVVFFIDELDRCRPDFAVATIERVKHIFSVPGISFVLGANHAQLTGAVRSVYGQGTDAELYLERLVDLRFQLPVSTSEDLLSYTAIACGLVTTCQARRHGKEELETALGTLRGLSQLPWLTPRIQRCLSHYALILRTMPTPAQVYPGALMLLVIARLTHRSQYEQYLKGEIGGEVMCRLFGGLRNAEPREPDFPGHLAGRLRAEIYGLSQIEGEASLRSTQVGDSLRNAKQQRVGLWGSEEEFEFEILSAMRHASKELGLLVERLELVRQFSE